MIIRYVSIKYVYVGFAGCCNLPLLMLLLLVYKKSADVVIVGTPVHCDCKRFYHSSNLIYYLVYL